MSNPSKQKGTAFETQCVNFIKTVFKGVQRAPLTGGADEGDLHGVRKGMPLSGDSFFSTGEVIFQCKNQKKMDLSGWLNATKKQVENRLAKAPMTMKVRGVLLVKRRGVGPSNMEKTYAVMELGDLLQVLKDAGYQ